MIFNEKENDSCIMLTWHLCRLIIIAIIRY